MLNDPDSSPTLLTSVQNVATWVLQVIDVRLALLIGLAAFMLAVGFDSSGNRAEAADFASQSLVPVGLSPALTPPSTLLVSPTTGSTQRATAHRLRHGTLTAPILTSSRLTDAHFFTDLPAE
ncbi:MAG: hypothetical protein WBG38_13375 [Nodosilinea sp.]